MLKIKRERLDELENFGFKKEKLDNDDVYTKDIGFCDFIHVSCEDFGIWLNGELPDIPDVIYDLIEAGMVEKGDENERD